jgi:hypothetical protein
MRFTRNASGRLQLDLLDEPGWSAFVDIADDIVQTFDGTYGERVEDFATCYLDIVIGGRTVTLHLEQFMGICVFAAEEEADGIIQNIGNYLAVGQLYG